MKLRVTVGASFLTLTGGGARKHMIRAEISSGIRRCPLNGEVERFSFVNPHLMLTLKTKDSLT